MDLQQLVDTAGLAGFSGLVFWKLTEIAKALVHLSDAFIKMEERGYYIKHPGPTLVRDTSEDG